MSYLSLNIQPRKVEFTTLVLTDEIPSPTKIIKAPVTIGINVIFDEVSGAAIISVSKDGAKMSEETIDGIVNGEIPMVNQILIGETINLKKLLSFGTATDLVIPI